MTPQELLTHHVNRCIREGSPVVVEIPAPHVKVQSDYEIKDGRITSPGKFEGEPSFAPTYWNNALEGFADDDDGKVFTFRITLEEKLADPVLRAFMGRKRLLHLSEDEQGFVHCY